MQLDPLDWIVAAGILVLCFSPALLFGKRGKRSGKQTCKFFAAGRAAPWWLAGLSMVAATSAAIR